jgi:hypothetical protein
LFAVRREELRAAYNSPEGVALAREYSRWMLAKQANPQYQENGTDEKLAAFNAQTGSTWLGCETVAHQVAALYPGDDVIP